MRICRTLALLALFLTVCTLTGQTPSKKPVVYTSEYYPLHVGNKWTYKVKVGDAPVQMVEVAVDQEEIFNYKVIKDKKEAVEPTPIVRYRLKITSGSKELTEHVAVLSDGVYRFSAADKAIVPPLRILKLPLAKGESWKVDSTSENTSLAGTFICEDSTVQVPAGQYQAKHVSAQDFQFDGKKMILDYWFTPEFGIVKQHTVIGNNDVLMELEKFNKGK